MQHCIKLISGIIHRDNWRPASKLAGHCLSFFFPGDCLKEQQRQCPKILPPFSLVDTSVATSAFLVNHQQKEKRVQRKGPSSPDCQEVVRNRTASAPRPPTLPPGSLAASLEEETHLNLFSLTPHRRQPRQERGKRSRQRPRESGGEQDAVNMMPSAPQQVATSSWNPTGSRYFSLPHG